MAKKGLDAYKEHVKQALQLVKNKPSEKQILFVKSWNEWGEENYMEPDLLHGKGYIKAMKKYWMNTIIAMCN